MVDNASIHKSAYTKRELEEMGVEILLNIPYTPQLAPIKHVFRMVKQDYGTKRLNSLAIGTQIEPWNLIQSVFRSINQLKVIRIMNEGFMRWH